MPITLNTHTFDPALTTAREDHQELAGQDGRTIRINGILQGLPDTPAIEAALDNILAAASEDEITLLSLRPGRQLRVRRKKFTREVQKEALLGRFELILHAEDPFEEATDLTIWPWSVSNSPATRDITLNSTAPTPILLILQANNTLIEPSITDGTRTIAYDGVLPTGTVLELDGKRRQARIDGNDVTPYIPGEFPLLTPGPNTLTYTDDPTSTHNALIAIWFNERWW